MISFNNITVGLPCAQEKMDLKKCRRSILPAERGGDPSNQSEIIILQKEGQVFEPGRTQPDGAKDLPAQKERTRAQRVDHWASSW
jgi:hypothetical protein